MNDPILTTQWQRTREIAIASGVADHTAAVDQIRKVLEKLVKEGQAEVRHEIEHPNGSKQYLQWRATQ